LTFATIAIGVLTALPIGCSADGDPEQPDERSVADGGPPAAHVLPPSVGTANGPIAEPPGGGVADTGPSDAAPSYAAPSDAGPPAPPVGSLVLEGASLVVVATTADGLVLYLRTDKDGKLFLEAFDTTTLAVTPVQLVGAGLLAPTLLIGVVGNTVSIWGTLFGPIGALTVWSSSNGSSTLPSASSFGGLFAAADDGSRFAFSYNATLDGGARTDIATATATTIQSPEYVARDIDVTSYACIPSVRYVGLRLFTGGCEDGATTATIRTVAPDGVSVTLATGTLASFSTNADGTQAFVIRATGEAEVHSVPANAIAIVDNGVLSGMFLANGDVVYTTALGALKRASPSTAGSAVFLAQGAREILAVSNDASHAVVASQAPDTENPLAIRYDIHVADLSAPGSLVDLVTSPTGVVLGFTPSSNHLLFLSDVPSSDLSDMILWAYPTAGGAPLKLARGYVRATFDPSSGADTVLVKSASSLGGVDEPIEAAVIDLSGPTATTTAKLAVHDALGAAMHAHTLYYAIAGKGIYAATF
jgi:hypothetical protein